MKLINGVAAVITIASAGIWLASIFNNDKNEIVVNISSENLDSSLGSIEKRIQDIQNQINDLAVTKPAVKNSADETVNQIDTSILNTVDKKPLQIVNDNSINTCPTGLVALDGVCIDQRWANYITCIRLQGENIEGEIYGYSQEASKIVVETCRELAVSIDEKI